MKLKDSVKDFEARLKSCTEFSVEGIKHICTQIGPRPCGEKPEQDAQSYMMKELEKFADTVKREPFEVHPEAFMGFVPVAATGLLASTAANFIGAFKKPGAALASIGFTAATLTSVVGEFGMYKKLLDPFFKKKTSGNVIAVRRAKGEIKRRIIISGHTDSAPEWTYTYKMGSHGVITVVGYALVGLVENIATTAVLLTSKNQKLRKAVTLGQLAFVPAYAALYKFTNNKRYVPGANDDLTGCYVAMSAIKFLAESDIRFENTEVVAVLAGGEEAGLRGSKAYFKAHPRMKDDGIETVFVSFDTIRDSEYMMIYERDMTGFVRNDERVCRLVKEAAAECGCDVPLGTIPLGSTDAAAASQAGIPAASFVAMDPAPARYYHTRLDTEEILEADTIEKGINIALNTIFSFDENGIN